MVDKIKKIKYGKIMKIGNYANIKDLALTLAGNFIEEEIPQNVLNEIYEEYKERIEIYRNGIGIGNKYYFGHLHDSPILSLKKIKGNMHLKLNDISTLEFACALIEKMKLKINIRKLVFPLEIISEETKYFSSNIVDVNGNVYEDKLMKVTEYLYEEIIEWTDENKEIAFDLWTGKLKPRRILLLLSCKNLKIIEGQKEYWKKYFGEEYNEYYDVFVKERNNGEYLSDYSLCIRFLEKIIKKK
jgi:hypothetical protein